jgi:hypothetical protein
MEDISNKPIAIINSTYLKDMIAEQTSQIYKLYGRVGDLVTERNELKKENDRLLSQIKRLSEFDKLD